MASSNCESRVCSSSLHNEIRNGLTHVEQKRFLFFVCVLSINVALMVPRWASAQDKRECLPHCWKKEVFESESLEPSLRVSFTENLFEEQDCKDACFNKEACLGAYWGYDHWSTTNICMLKILGESGSAVALKKANHWTLVDCSDDCFPYCWKPKLENIDSLGAIPEPGVNDEERCKLLCSKDQSCIGVEWNTIEGQCWILLRTNLPTRHSEVSINHWEITRNLPIDCEHGSLLTAPNENASVPVGEPMTSPAATEAPGETTSVAPPAVPPDVPPAVPTDSPTAPTTAVSPGVLPTATPERTTATVPPTLPQTVPPDVTPAVTPEETTSVVPPDVPPAVPPAVPPVVPPVFPPAPTPAFSPAVSPAVPPAVPSDFPPGPTPDASPAVLPSNATAFEANTTPLSGLRAGESSPEYGSAHAGLARGGSAVGESNIGNDSAPAVGVPTRGFPTGIVALAVVMEVLVLVIIGVIAYKISICFGQAKTDSRLSLRDDSLRGYQSIGTFPDTAESSDPETAYRAD